MQKKEETETRVERATLIDNVPAKDFYELRDSVVNLMRYLKEERESKLPEQLDTHQAAKALKVSDHWAVRRLIQRGKLKPEKRQRGGKIFISRKEIMRYLGKNTGEI